jgi:predicted Zn-dependent protease
VVKGTNNDWYNNIDLRVDDSHDPFGDLARPLSYHYGRIRINQAVYAINMGNLQRGRMLLSQAEAMVKGWNGIQGKIALAYLLRNEPGMQEFFCEPTPTGSGSTGNRGPGVSAHGHEKPMTEKDWIAAISLVDQLNRPAAEDSLCRRALQQFPQSSYLYYQLGQTLQSENQPAAAKTALQHSLTLDPANAEAAQALSKLP